MPGRRTRAAAKPLTLGIAGSGELDKKALVSLLDDFVEGRDVAALYIPVTDDDYTDEVALVVDWAVENGVPYTTISDEAAGKDKDLKKVIAGAADDYDAGDDAGKAIVELLAGDEDEPVEDGRLLVFLDQDQDADVAVCEEADQLEVAAYDLCNGLEAIKFGDDDEGAGSVPDGDGDETTPPAEEPEPEAAPTSRRRRASKTAEERETVVEGGAFGSEPLHAVTDTEEELLKLSLVELKKKAKALDPATHTTESLRGLQKPEVIALLLGSDDGEADEAQASVAPAATASEAVDGPQAGSDEAETREAVFARLRANRERAEAISVNLSGALKVFAAEGNTEEAAERAAAAVASSLMLFAEFIISEVRKPKSPGRPRKDGTEAQPRAVAEEAPAKPRRGRRSAS